MAFLLDFWRLLVFGSEIAHMKLDTGHIVEESRLFKEYLRIVSLNSQFIYFNYFCHWSYANLY